MENTRDVEAISIKITGATSLGSSTISQSCEPKNDKNIVPDNDNASKLSLVVEALNETIAENNARSKEFTELFNALDIDPKSMPKDIQDSWSKVSAILRAEGLTDMDETLLTIRMEHKRRESKKKAREERKLKTKYNELCDRHSVLLDKQNRCLNAVQSLQKVIESEEIKSQEEYTNRIFMATKLNDYRRRELELDETLTKMEVKECYPDKILDKYNAYLELMEELNAVDESLSKYGELPPNLIEARVTVEEKERYLKNLEHALFEKMK